MKLNKLFLGAIAALASAAMVACSDDAPDINNGGENGDGDARYLAVRIVSTPTGDSRAETGANGEIFEEGTTDENKVTKVRFYFFTEGGDAKIVKKDATANWYDWTPTEDPTDDTKPNLDKKLEAVLIINTKAGDNLPAQVIAVLNPEQVTSLGEGSWNLENFRKRTADFATLANTNNVFPMTNSVYANTAETEVYATTKLTLDNFKTSEEAAKTDPVDIYVERNVAKIRAKLATNLVNTDNLVLAKDAEGKNITISGQQVYIQVNGWNLTNTLPNADISKHIDLRWDTQTLGSNIPWNSETYYRSYWATQNTGVGSGAGQSNNTRLPYKDYANIQFPASVYANENAQRLGDSGLEPTQIVMSATLCDAGGNSLTISEFAGSKVIDTTVDNIPHYTLKSTILDFLSLSGTRYYKKTADNKLTEISQADITFKTNGSLNEDATSKFYTVYAQLTEEASKAEWFTSPDGTVTTTAAAINQALINLGAAQIYNNGNTYYFANIKHFTRDGLVRNHIYDLTITSIVGLGTPVYNPEEIIIPETPVSEDSYLAAQIHILMWRVMGQNVNFGQ